MLNAYLIEQAELLNLKAPQKELQFSDPVFDWSEWAVATPCLAAPRMVQHPHIKPKGLNYAGLKAWSSH